MAKIIKIAQKVPQASFAEIKAQLAARGKEIVVRRKEENGSIAQFTGKVVDIFNLGSKVELHGEAFFTEHRADGLPFRFSKVEGEWVLTC